MKSKFITARKITAGRVALLVAAGLLVGTASAHAEVAPTPAPTKTPSQYQVDRAAYMISKFRHVSDRVTFRKEDDIDALTAWAIILHSEKRGGLRMQRDRHKQQKD